MITVWVFFILSQYGMTEVGKFSSEESCESQRQELIIYRTTLGYGGRSNGGGPYTLTKYFETTQCMKVLK